jgi:SMI1/KNR4 family protein SUKH-1
MIGSRLKNLWLSKAIEVNPGVSDEDLAAFEAAYEISLPSDMRDYFLHVNRMAEGVSDPALLSFWPLNEVKPIPETAPAFSNLAYISDSQSLFLFADFCIWSHAYAIRLSNSHAISNPNIRDWLRKTNTTVQLILRTCKRLLDRAG